MSEGKLYSKIKDEIQADWSDKLFRNADYEKGELVSQEQTLKEILEEAKVEFPIPLNPENITILKEEIKERKANVGLTVRDEDIIKILTWTLKWFGASNANQQTKEGKE